MNKIMHYAGKNIRYIYQAVFCILIAVICGIVPYFLVNDLLLKLIKEQPISIKYVVYLGSSIGLFLLLKALMYAIGIKLSHKGAYRTLARMRKKLADRMVKQPLGFVQSAGAGSYKQKFVEDIGKIEFNLAHLIPEGIPNLVLPLAVFIIIFCKDWRMGLLSLGSLPFGIGAMGLIAKIGLKNMPAYYASQAELGNTIVEYISGMPVIKVFGKTAASYEKYGNSVERYRDLGYAWSKRLWKAMAVETTLLPCVIILTLPVGLLMYHNGTVSLDTLLFTLMLNLGIGIPLGKAFSFIPLIVKTKQVILELEKAFDYPDLQTGKLTKHPDNYGIEFKNVSFAYDDTTVINNVSFQIKQNELTALVGPSGGGKSTIAKLLVHYYDVKGGSINIGGIDIRDYTQDVHADIISYVSQDSFLFDETIMENIRIGKQDATDEEIIKAAKSASIHDFIISLEKGYQTVVGSSGGKLSGGEKQRITIARALLKNAPILILDEATAYADSENEDLIQDAIGKLMKNKTVIVIAHRLRSIANADKILVINNGEIISSGIHKELLECSLAYKELWLANERTYNWELEV